MWVGLSGGLVDDNEKARMLLSKTKPNCVRLPVVGKKKAFGGEGEGKVEDMYVVLTYVNESVMSLGDGKNHYYGSGNNNQHDKKRLAPKTNAPDPLAPDPLADTKRNELVIQSQSQVIIRLRQDNRDLIGQLEAISDQLDTCEAEVIRTDQCLQSLLHASPKDPPPGPSKLIIHHININHDDEDDKPQSIPNDLTEEEGDKAEDCGPCR
jgi:hypothetical protein